MYTTVISFFGIENPLKEILCFVLSLVFFTLLPNIMNLFVVIVLKIRNLITKKKVSDKAIENISVAYFIITIIAAGIYFVIANITGRNISGLINIIGFSLFHFVIGAFGYTLWAILGCAYANGRLYSAVGEDEKEEKEE